MKIHDSQKNSFSPHCASLGLPMFLRRILSLALILLTASLSAVAQEDDILVTDKLMEHYLGKNDSIYSASEHIFGTVFMGLVSGVAFGAAGSLVAYNSSDETANLNNLYLYGGVFGIGGALTGLGIAAAEQIQDDYFSMGPDALEYTWFGTLGGATLGAMAGAIPYASSGNTDELLHYTGYGAMAGLATGLTLWLFKIPSYYSISSYVTPDQWSIGLRYSWY